MTAPTDASTIDPGVRRTAVSWVVLGLAVAATPYAARPFGLVVPVAAMVEVVDHVVPGLAAVALAGGLLAAPRWRFELALVVVLAGLWTTGTHLPLLLDAARGLVDWPTALWHTTPGVALLSGAAWTAARELRGSGPRPDHELQGD